MFDQWDYDEKYGDTTPTAEYTIELITHIPGQHHDTTPAAEHHLAQFADIDELFHSLQTPEGNTTPAYYEYTTTAPSEEEALENFNTDYPGHQHHITNIKNHDTEEITTYNHQAPQTTHQAA